MAFTARQSGFTLIELSIVLVIIGLIIGGVLVGQDLINAATTRSQVGQIEKYNGAVNTFRGKYGGLPGDLDASKASGFGFVARGAFEGEGDGNGFIQAVNVDGAGQMGGNFQGFGETTVFWVDLSTANLIDGAFSTASSTFNPGIITVSSSPNLDAFLPRAKIGGGNYVSVYNGGRSAPPWGAGDGINYFAISAISQFDAGWAPDSTPTIAVVQAYNIDLKIDDGLPQTGTVTAVYTNGGTPPAWVGGAVGVATAAASTTCYDNGNVGGATQLYSVGQNQGAGKNCALSFRFQ